MKKKTVKKVSKKNINEIEAAIKTLKMMGYKTTSPRNKNSNGVDIFAIKIDKALSVEIKKASYPNKNSKVLRVRRVEVNRKKDDLIAIVLPNGYCLVEPMRDHLKCCNGQGDRFLNY